MSEFIVEAGWGIWPVLLFGLTALGLAGWQAIAPRTERLALLIAALLATLLAGGLGTVTGLENTVLYVTHHAPTAFGTFLVGLRESLHNLLAAMVLALLATLVAAPGVYRLHAQHPASSRDAATERSA